MVNAAADGIGPAELVRLVAIARRFYVDGRSKLEIAEEFSLSRFKIARLIDHALASGIVRIEVGVPAQIDADLSERIRTSYQLRHAIVVDAPRTPKPTCGPISRVSPPTCSPRLSSRETSLDWATVARSPS